MPQVRRQPQYHNPFPQLHRVAILPFYNLSANPYVNQDDVAEAYFVELQQIPGFEVMPPGVVKQILTLHEIEIDSATDFQRLAQMLGVDVLIRGAVTEFDPYYPPRFGISVDWFAANPTFHPIPPGYGLPWGTKQEARIADSVVFEAEFALAREQLKTQTPEMSNAAAAAQVSATDPVAPERLPQATDTAPAMVEEAAGYLPLSAAAGPDLPEGWPDPRGFIPPPPSPLKPPYRPQPEPIISHTRLYAGDDDTFTENLDNYFYFRDDARFGGWQSYLRRSDDFIRFCCHLHIAETLSARGGAGKTRVVWRWPFGRYDVGTGRR